MRVYFLLTIAFGMGCVSSRVGERDIDQLFFRGEWDQASKKLEEGLTRAGEGQDQLLYLLDLGLTLHTAGHYRESNQYLLKAASVTEIKDYTSIADEAVTLFVSDNIKHYQGEDFEKVLVHAYLALNYTLLSEYEDALVEARQVNQILYRMVHEGNRKYKESGFARYLSAVIYEATGEWDHAYIDYKKSTELTGDFPWLGQDLWRLAKLNRFSDDAKRWESEYHLSEEVTRMPRRSTEGELVLIYQNGISPVKRPNPQFHSLPVFVPRANPVVRAVVEVDGMPRAVTSVVEDIEQRAIENLNEKYGALIAKKIAGVVAKEIVADQVSKATKNEFWGFLTRVFFYAGDTADLRSWNLLPRDIQMARIPLSAGTHRIRVVPEGARSGTIELTTEIRPGKISFANARYCPP